MAHPRKQVLFVLLGLADLATTCWLLDRSGGHLHEANPVARWWLDCHGWAGLACIKGVAVALVLGLSLLIARSRPRATGRVLGLGCAASALVVLYSAALCPASYQSPEEREIELTREAYKALEEAAKALQARQLFLEQMARLGEGLIAGRRTLREAAAEYGRSPELRRALAVVYPGRPLQEAFAGCVMCHVVGALDGDPRTAWPLALRLEREFRQTYGSTPPLVHRSSLRGPGPDGDAVLFAYHRVNPEN